ncbi:MAG TPA: S8 family serine peptidase, partial [Sedimentisphaerales bacterium]|nr:S8 family serine peptidase [Sedimentisphaerales bacterium]
MKMKTLLTILACVPLIVCVPASFAQPGKGNPNIVPGSYIVQVADDEDPAAVAAEVARFANGAVGHIYEYALRGFSIQVPPGITIASLRARRGVMTVEPDLIAHTCAQTIPTGIARINAVPTGAPSSVDVDIAIIDTGIDTTHPDLTVVGGRRFYTRGWRSYQDNQYNDDNGHGSHVAGIAAAKNNDIGVVGVAPGARLWAVKVLDSTGSGYFSDIIKGVDWVTANAGTIEVANMSLGGQGKSDSLRKAIENSAGAGVTYVVAAGNEDDDIYGPDHTYNTSDDHIPAAYGGSISGVYTISAFADSDGNPGGVGSSTSYGADDSFATFSNYSVAGAIAYVMPGVSIYSTYKNGGYATMSGTSMASPHAAGLFALGIGTNNTAIPYAVAQTSSTGLVNGGDTDGVLEPLGYATNAAGDTAAPAPPTDLSATAGDGKITLNWSDNPEEDVLGYNVYRRTSESYGSPLATLVANSAYEDLSATSGTTYYYVVTAVDTSGNESGPSNEDKATPTGGSGSGATMHVASIDMSLSTRNAGKNKFTQAVATVTIVDADGIRVGGATVYGSWSGATSDADYGVTNASGQVALSS